MKIIVLGFGHMGSWIARELSKFNDVFIYDTDKRKIKGTKGLGVIQKIKDISCISPQMLINAVSLPNTIEAFNSAVKFLSEECLLCDLASVKAELAEYYKRSPFKFFSAHPMFGPTFANVASLWDENVIIIKESHPQGVSFFEPFFKSLGLKIYEYTFEEHDQMIAYSLTLPFVSSLAFAACLDKRPVPGTTFKKHLFISKGLLSEDDYLLSEILFNPHSLPQVEKVTNRLEFLKHIIKARDFEEAKSFFNRLRENLK